MPLLPWFRGASLRDTIRARYAGSGAERYGISVVAFEAHVERVIDRYAAGRIEGDKIALVETLHLDELMLARACTAGQERAWDDFLARYRSDLQRAACAITRDDAAGRELADELYAELYGLPNRDGRRVPKLDYYMGRGSLAGWLRTVLAQKHIDRCRAGVRTVSLEEEVENGVAFAAPPTSIAAPPAGSLVAALADALHECTPEQRLLLASYYLDGSTLAQIGQRLGVHESTISRRLERLSADLRKRVRKRLIAAGVSARRCDEMMNELDVRDLEIDVAATLQQEKQIGTF